MIGQADRILDLLNPCGRSNPPPPPKNHNVRIDTVPNSAEAIKERDHSGAAVGMLGFRNSCEEAVEGINGWLGILI